MKKGTSPRELAVRLLFECFHLNRPLDRLFLKPSVDRLDDRDRRLVKELVYGTLRNKLQLDYLINQLSKRPLARTDEVILWILRVAIYQLRFLRIPDHAAVNETVSLCRKLRKASASSFVNALLRNYLRKPPDLPVGDSIEELSIRFSHPGWLIKRYLNRYGKVDAKALMERNNRSPESIVWVNPLKCEVKAFCRQLQQEGIGAECLKDLPRAVEIDSENFIQHPFYRNGCCFFMDPNSQRIVESVNLEGRFWVGDLCAAPGNKSFILAVRKSPRANLISAYANWRRMVEMKQRLDLYGMAEVHLVVQSLEKAPALSRRLSWILLDVPCSGLGTIRSNPDIRWKITEEELNFFQERQLLYLRNGFRALGQEGELLYVTCSTEPEENEQVIDRFLAEEPEAQRAGTDEIRFSIGLHGDGFYTSRVRRL